MGGIIETGSAILAATERKLEIAAQNVANISTAGYKRQVAFADHIAAMDSRQLSRPDQDVPEQDIRSDIAQGGLRRTGNPLDIAISGDGFFLVRGEHENFYTRQGEFRLDAEGRLVTAQGLAVQGEDGDIVLGTSEAEITENGTVVEDGLPVARIAVYSPDKAEDLHALGGSLFTAAERAMSPARAYVLRQAMVETSNVTMASEMVGMMAAVREAETGAKLVQVYDDLMGRALTAFGQGAR